MVDDDDSNQSNYIELSLSSKGSQISNENLIVYSPAQSVIKLYSGNIFFFILIVKDLHDLSFSVVDENCENSNLTNLTNISEISISQLESNISRDSILPTSLSQSIKEIKKGNHFLFINCRKSDCKTYIVKY